DDRFVTGYDLQVAARVPLEGDAGAVIQVRQQGVLVGNRVDVLAPELEQEHVEVLSVEHGRVDVGAVQRAALAGHGQAQVRGGRGATLGLHGKSLHAGEHQAVARRIECRLDS